MGDANRDSLLVILDFESREGMDPGKNSSPSEGIQSGIGISSRDEHSFGMFSVLALPLHRDPMGRVFAGNPKGCGKSFRTDFFQSDQADAGNGMTSMELGAEGRRKDLCRDLGIHSIVQKNAAADDTLNRGDLHGERFNWLRVGATRSRGEAIFLQTFSNTTGLSPRRYPVWCRK